MSHLHASYRLFAVQRTALHTLRYLDFDLLRLRFLCLRQTDGQNAILVRSVDFVALHGGWECEPSWERRSLRGRMPARISFLRLVDIVIQRITMSTNVYSALEGEVR